MADLSLEISEKIIDACKAGAGDAGASLSSALDSAMQITDIVAGDPIVPDGLPGDLAGPGLALVFHATDGGLALLLPEATNLLPTWYANPDPTGESKLQTLAQGLAMLLLPEDLAIGKFAAGAVEDIGGALSKATTANPCGSVRLSMKGDDGSGAFYLCWPLHNADDLIPAPKPQAEHPQTENITAPPTEVTSYAGELQSLPSYSRSLLNIRVPVVVNLATTKMPVEDIVNLGQGAIIQFEKSCEESLELEAGGHKLAAGEAVKVGDKFGLRITSIRLPDERYQTVGE